MRRMLITLIVVFLFASVDLSVPTVLAQDIEKKGPDYKALNRFRQVMQTVSKNYFREVTDKELIDGAIQGMLTNLDQRSSYISPTEFKELQTETKGEFGAAGLEITIKDGALTIVSPIEGSPGHSAGLKSGDKIVKIDGESTKGITLAKAVKMMRGPKGSKVTFTIIRDGLSAATDFVVVREHVNVKPVKAALLSEGYPCVKLTSFSQGTCDELAKAIEGFGGDERIKGLILDLRNNPGGLLDEAIKTAGLFVEKGLIAYTDGRVKDQRVEYQSQASQKHFGFLMAVLINDGTASGSEIVAGALQDYNRALIFGTRSFGHSSIQTIIPLEDGSALRLTTAQFYTPKGRHIQESGINPNIEIKDKSQITGEDLGKKSGKQILEEDIVIKRALDWLKTGSISQ